MEKFNQTSSVQEINSRRYSHSTRGALCVVHVSGFICEMKREEKRVRQAADF